MVDKVDEVEQKSSINNKIDAETRKEVVLMLASGDTIPTVLKRLEQDYSISVSYQNIHHNYAKKPKIIKRIAELRETMNEKLMKIPIANKSVRLLKLQEAIELALHRAKVRYVYNSDGELTETIYEHNVGPVAGLIREVGNLMEGFEGGKGANITLIQVLKDFSKWERETMLDGKGHTERKGLDFEESGKANRMDSPSAGNYEVL